MTLPFKGRAYGQKNTKIQSRIPPLHLERTCNLSATANGTPGKSQGKVSTKSPTAKKQSRSKDDIIEKKEAQQNIISFFTSVCADESGLLSNQPIVDSLQERQPVSDQSNKAARYHVPKGSACFDPVKNSINNREEEIDFSFEQDPPHLSSDCVIWEKDDIFLSWNWMVGDIELAHYSEDDFVDQGSQKVFCIPYCN